MATRILYFLMPIFKVFIFLCFAVICFFPTLIILSYDFISVDENSLITQIFYQFGITIAVLGALLMTFKVFGNYDFESVFIQRDIFQGFLKGSFIGFILISCCAGAALLSGNVTFILGKISLPLFLGYLIFYILVSCFEEFLFRSFPLRAFAERFPIAIAILLSSMLFGLAHLGNTGFNWLAMLNITLAGILFAIFVLQKNNISWAIGIHFGWNFTQGTLLGYQVSGTDSPGLLVAKPLGNQYLSGGIFGVESSIYCTAILFIVIAYLLYKNDMEPVYENLMVDKLKEH